MLGWWGSVLAPSSSPSTCTDKAVFEWAQLQWEEPVLFQIQPLKEMEAGRGRAISAERVHVPNYAERLPEPLRRFTKQGVYDESNPHLSFLQGGGHGGSHLHGRR